MSPSASKIRVLCCITTKNAESTISNLFSDFSSEMIGLLDEIVIIDNASKDSTIEIVKQSIADKKFENCNINIFRNASNYGLGGSHKTALKYALKEGFDYLLIVHGDNLSSPNQFLNVLKGSFYKYDMILSTRLESGSKRVNYSFGRFFFNKVISLLSSLLFFRSIKDLSSGGINLYRVQTLYNKFENPLKCFSNEVDFSQYALLYGVYRKCSFYFQPIDITEIESKSFVRMVSQFVKAIILIFRFRFIPQSIVQRNLYGSFFGYEYYSINKVVENVADNISIDKTNADESIVIKDVEAKKPKASELVEPPVTKPSVSEPKGIENRSSTLSVVADSAKETAFRFTDLRRMSVKDNFSQSFDAISFSVVEAIEKANKGHLVLDVDLDMNNLIGHGLKSFFLRTFKIFTPGKLIVFLNANENILKTKQCLEFADFLNRFNVNFKIISTNPNNLKMWNFYTKKPSAIVLNFEYGVLHRSEFFNLAKSLSKENNVFVNIQTSAEKFYYCYGLKERLVSEEIAKNVLLIPYGATGEECEPDHKEILDSQPVKYFNEKNISLKFSHSIESGGIDYFKMASDKEDDIQLIKIDSIGAVYSINALKEEVPCGSIFNDNEMGSNLFLN